MLPTKAEARGFEPLVRFPVHLFSRQAPSTPQTRLRFRQERWINYHIPEFISILFPSRVLSDFLSREEVLVHTTQTRRNEARGENRQNPTGCEHRGWKVY